MREIRRGLSSTLFTGVLLLSTACDPLAPFQPEVGNTNDTFQFQATDLRTVSLTRTYRWDHTGTIANINQATTLTNGTAVLHITDASGAEVYRKDLTENGTFRTAAGSPGRWTIRVEFSRASGTVNFRVQHQ